MRKGLIFGGFAATFAALIIVGCGGGGSSSTTSTTSTTSGGTTYPLTSTLRTYQGTETYSYILKSGTQTVNGGTANNVDTTAFNRAVTLTKPSGSSGFEAKTVDLLTVNGGLQTLSEDIMVKQLTTGDLQFTGTPTTAAATPVTILPGSWTSSSNLTGSTTVGATNVSVNFTVTGSEAVTIGLGSFTTYKVTISHVEGTVTRSGTYWWSPKLGTYVKASETITDSSTNTTTVLNVELSSSSVPLGG